MPDGRGSSAFADYVIGPAWLTSFVSRLHAHMKWNAIVGVILVIVATNLFTYAATRYWIGDHILTNAHENARLTMEKQKSGEMPPHPGQSPEGQVLMAISMTEGMYHGEDTFIFFVWFAPSLLLTGLYFLSRNAKVG